MAGAPYRVIDVREVARWDEEADVVVAGLGCAGACAAIEARAAGRGRARARARERRRRRHCDGGGPRLLGRRHARAERGRRRGQRGGHGEVPDRRTRPRPTREKIHLYCDESVAHFDWLVAQGVPFNDTMYKGKHVLQMTDECLIWSGNEEAWPYREQAKPAPRGHKVAQVAEAGGAKMMEILIARARALGVRIEIDAAVRELVREGERIVGVRYRNFERERSVRARRGVCSRPATSRTTRRCSRKLRARPARPSASTRQYTPNDDGAGIQLGARGRRRGAPHGRRADHLSRSIRRSS